MVAERARDAKAKKKIRTIGIRLRWTTGNKLPNQFRFLQCQAATSVFFSLSLFLPIKLKMLEKTQYWLQLALITYLLKRNGSNYIVF